MWRNICCWQLVSWSRSRSRLVQVKRNIDRFGFDTRQLQSRNIVNLFFAKLQRRNWRILTWRHNFELKISYCRYYYVVELSHANYCGNFRLLGLLTERSVVLVYYCYVMAIVELWIILKLLFAKVFFEIIFAEKDVIYHNFEFKMLELLLHSSFSLS